MVVQHNLTAMNSNRLLGLTTSAQAKSTEKLSSGYKINRAADDAAGLSISEKMRKQIRGLTQASANAQDGISAVQTAEGALSEVQDMLQRMNELAVKSANGTMSESDRSYIQNEIDQLTTEIDRVAETTKFNETYLLKGNKDADKEYAFSYGGTSGTATIANGTSLYKADGTAIADAAALTAYLNEDPKAKLYTTAPQDAVLNNPLYDENGNSITTSSQLNSLFAGNASPALYSTAPTIPNELTAEDIEFVPASATAVIGGASLFEDGNATALSSGDDATSRINAAGDDFAAGVTLYKANGSSSLADADLESGAVSSISGTNLKSGTSILLRDNTSGDIITVDDQADLGTYFDDGGAIKANFTIVEEAVIGDLTVSQEAAKFIDPSDDSTVQAYNKTGTEILAANYNGTDKLYEAGGAAGTPATEGDGNDYTAPVAGVLATEGTGGDYTAPSKPSFYDKEGNKIAENALSNYFEYDGTSITQKAGTKLYDAAGTEVTADAAKIAEMMDPAPEELVGNLTLNLHVGADATDNNQISVKLAAMSATGLGVKGLKVDGTDDTNAKNAIDTIKEAIQKVSTQRSALGAAQNRLEHTISNLDNVVENTTAAESSIRDTDMATEMVKYSNNNILAQAGQAMLAQANQSNQGVLSLLG